MQIWPITTKTQTLILASQDQGLPEIIYWGDVLTDLTDQDLIDLVQLHQMDVTGGMVDQNVALSVCPEAARSFSGHPGLMIRDQKGQVLRPYFQYDSHEVTSEQIMCLFKDADLGMTYQLVIRQMDGDHVIEMRARISGQQPFILSYLAAPVVPGPQQATHMLDVSGRWIDEFQINQIPWRRGAHLRENRTGRSGHEAFPALLLPEDGTKNQQGAVYGLIFGWSGGHRMVAEELPDGRRQIQFAAAQDSETEPVTDYQTPPLYLAYSNAGLSRLGVIWQRFVRDGLIDQARLRMPRPVHYNCWEAVYFDHKLDQLCELVTQAAAIGAERFVLDDGWFGKRHDDTSSLGDWQIDPDKFPDGFTPLIGAIHQAGMGFGLWVEPEMINKASDLYQAHPDWILGPASQAVGRQQYVLDMGREDVQDYLYQSLSHLLRNYQIDYLKWDHNRILPICDNHQIRAVYRLIDRLRADFPNVEIESCASGGGRLDYGMLERADRVWLSDSNDALQRARIQYQSSLFLPSIIVGSHVGPSPCHTSGRQHSLSFRAWVAASRHLGFEMDLTALSPTDRQTLTDITSWWKQRRDWLLQADILRLDHNDPNILAEIHVTPDQKKFVLFITILRESAQVLPRPLKLSGLLDQENYRISLVNKQDMPALSRGSMALKDRDLTISGRILHQKGLNLPWSFPEHIWVVEGQLQEGNTV